MASQTDKKLLAAASAISNAPKCGYATLSHIDNVFKEVGRPEEMTNSERAAAGVRLVEEKARDFELALNRVFSLISLANLYQTVQRISNDVCRETVHEEVLALGRRVCEIARDVLPETVVGGETTVAAAGSSTDQISESLICQFWPRISAALSKIRLVDADLAWTLLLKESRRTINWLRTTEGRKHVREFDPCDDPGFSDTGGAVVYAADAGACSASN